ncbi:rab-GTPase-TBC domain-containing protein, partial [Mortierella sp. GBAus27b]
MGSRLDATLSAELDRRRISKKQQEQSRVDELKWVQALMQQPDQIKKSAKFKKMARRGIPSSVRGRVWLFLADANRYREPGKFQELLTRGHIPIYDVIARDVHRCYPDHVHFRDGMGGQEDLHAILKAYAHYKPSVGYCQGMGRLVGMMLMQMHVEDAFWLLVATIECYLSEYYTPTLRQLRVDAQVFEQLLQNQDPRLAQHLKRNDVMPIMYMTQWFLTLFTMSLPWASVLRVWDMFYFDGVKALFRTGLAVLQLCRQHLLDNCPSSSECMDYLLHVPLDILGPEALLEKTAFRIKLRKENIERMSALSAGEMDA